ncbi:hypothetical protein Pint_11768 [Pistacia integerrima]|uniref:Uncharacterized protein n=1 Tax=Pistacia integerrima TaxID=434235 RepID=A0ACC0XKX5_9ROSI|nr:hypothetical protein Pint_11768 [Pistacia integerrima]
MSSSISFPVSIILLLLHLAISASAAYPGNSYKHEETSRKLYMGKVKEWYDKDKSIAASLLRLHFHDCAVRGCDASILLNHERSERMANASKPLRGFEVIDDIKKEIEKKCPKTVSCADILTAVARDATGMVDGGRYWTVEYGRKDGFYSYDTEADELVPKGHESITSLLELFQSMGLDVSDLVILSGAHTIGRSSCGAIQDRIYNFNGYGKPDESIDKKYLNYLQRKCRWASEYVDLDATTPNTFDTNYYQNLEKKMGLLSTDQLLYSDSRTKCIATALADMKSHTYTQLFGAAMTKLGKVNVLTGNDEGEIRSECSVVNSHKY